MMECGGNLNDPLKQRLLLSGRAQPKFLPHLVRLEKLVCVEVRHSSFELFVFVHRSREICL